MVLAYLIPLSQGWAQAQTAAITVMLIAAMGSVSESIHKGAMRVVGTVIGAIIGMTLIIALFTQDRFLYLLSLSIAVSIVLYILRAYKGDPSMYMLTAITMMMVFKNGEVDDVLIFGLDKTYMTLFGILMYTLVGVFLWPDNIEDKSKEDATVLSKAAYELFLHRDDRQENRERYTNALVEAETALLSSTREEGSADIELSQWYRVWCITIKIYMHSLHSLPCMTKKPYVSDLSHYVENYETLESEITDLFKALNSVWENKEEISIPSEFTPAYNKERIAILSHLDRASLITTMQDMQKLHTQLIRLATKINAIHSPLPTHFEAEAMPDQKRFLWGDIEHLKGVAVTFIIFWVATYFWIEMNPPGGFMIVALATGLSVLTTFTPIKPSLLIMVFSISFVFATFMYLAVLPHLRYGWELGLFIFFYSFVSFYLVNPKMTIFFLLGLFTFNIMNTMYYDFSIFLLVLLLFYLFLFLLHIFYYVPFSTKPEYLFLVMKNRFFRLSYYILDRSRKQQEGRETLWLKLAGMYSRTHLMPTVANMQLWASQINTKYFSSIEQETLLTFGKQCERFGYLVTLLYKRDTTMQNNRLLLKLRKEYNLPYFSELLDAYAAGKNYEEVNDFWHDEKHIVQRVEDSLSAILEKIDFSEYTHKEISEMYENISLRRNVWLALFRCQESMKKLDFKTLEDNRF